MGYRADMASGPPLKRDVGLYARRAWNTAKATGWWYILVFLATEGLVNIATSRPPEAKPTGR